MSKQEPRRPHRNTIQNKKSAKVELSPLRIKKASTVEMTAVKSGRTLFIEQNKKEKANLTNSIAQIMNKKIEDKIGFEKKRIELNNMSDQE